jgi:hypothetical protein
MAVGDSLNAPAKQAGTRIGNAENLMGARAKSAHHEVAGLDKWSLCDCGMRNVNASHGRHLGAEMLQI